MLGAGEIEAERHLSMRALVNGPSPVAQLAIPCWFSAGNEGEGMTPIHVPMVSFRGISKFIPPLLGHSLL